MEALDAAPLEFRPSRRRLLALAALCLPLVAGAWFCTTRPETGVQVAGWVGVVLFGVAPFVLVRQALRSDPDVVFSQHGFEVRRLGIGPIPWSEVADAFEARAGTSRFLCLRLVRPEVILAAQPGWKRRLADANQRMGYGDLSIAFDGLEPGLPAALAFVERACRADPERDG